MSLPHDPSASRGRPSAAFGVLVAIVALDAAAMSIVLPLVPFLALHMGASPLMVTLVIGTYAAALFVGAPLMGTLSDRFGRRAVLLAAVCGMAVANVVLALADTLWLLFAGRALAGLMAGNMTVAEALAANNSSEADRPKAMAAVGIAMAGGLVLGPLLSTGVLLMVPGPEGLQATFAGAAGVCALAAIALVAQWRRLDERIAPARARDAPLRLVARAFLSDAALLRLALCGAVAELAAMTSMALNALWLADRLDAGPELVGLHLSAIAAGMIAGQVLLLRDVGRGLGPVRMLSLALGLVGLGYFGLTFAPAIWATLPLFFMAYVGIAIVTALSLAGISSRVVPEHQGAALGLANGVRGVIQLVTPASVGLIFSAGLTDLPFRLVALAAAVMAAALWILRRSSDPAASAARAGAASGSSP